MAPRPIESDRAALAAALAPAPQADAHSRHISRLARPTRARYVRLRVREYHVCVAPGPPGGCSGLLRGATHHDAIVTMTITRDGRGRNAGEGEGPEGRRGIVHCIVSDSGSFCCGSRPERGVPPLPCAHGPRFASLRMGAVCDAAGDVDATALAAERARGRRCAMHLQPPPPPSHARLPKVVRCNCLQRVGWSVICSSTNSNDDRRA